MTEKTTPAAGRTPEQHTNNLMDEINDELDRYGAVSLADFIASTIDGRCSDERDDADSDTRTAAYWEDVRQVFEAAGERLQALERKYKYTPPQRGNVPPAADPDNPINDGAGEEKRR